MSSPTKIVLKPVILVTKYVHRCALYPKPEVARWLRHELVKYGPVYVKVGQFVAARKDYFPKHLTRELRNLQDNVDPLEYNDVQDVLREEQVLLHDIDVDPVPLSVASLGQVHLATLRGTGPNNKMKTKVCVKIQKPHVTQQIEEDLRALTWTFQVAARILPNNRSVADVCEILDQCNVALLHELDYTREKVNLMKMRKHMQEYGILVPRVVPSLSTPRVLVMEYIPSSKISAHANEQAARQLARGVALVAIKHGLVHGDLHQGNIGVRDGSAVLYDLGSVIEIDKNVVRKLFACVVTRNSQKVVNVLVDEDLVEVDPHFEQMGMYKLNRFVAHVVRYTEHLNVQTLIADISNDTFLQKGPMHFKANSELLLLSRTFGLLEGSCKEMYPDFNYDQVFLDVLTDAQVFLLMDHTAIWERGMDDLFMINNNGNGGRRRTRNEAPLPPPPPSFEPEANSPGAITKVLLLAILLKLLS